MLLTHAASGGLAHGTTDGGPEDRVYYDQTLGIAACLQVRRPAARAQEGEPGQPTWPAQYADPRFRILQDRPAMGTSDVWMVI